jgi:broad specificity phosphatase PhoE
MRSASPVRRLLAAALLAAPTFSACRTAPAVRAEPSGPVVYLVRHGEKAAEPAGDPPLSPAGQARAAALAARLAGAGVHTVLVTPTRRTAETAAPLAGARGLTPVAVPFSPAVDEHARAVAAAVTAALAARSGGSVLVVGHSNTVPAIVGALGAPRPADLCDAAYATLFVVRPGSAGAPATVTREPYGAPDTAACALAPAAPAR